MTFTKVRKYLSLYHNFHFSLKVVTLLLLAQCVAGARKLRGNQDITRGAKSLVNTFPFNANEREEDHHEHHEEHAAHEPSQSLDTRFSRQGEDEAVVDFAAVAEAGCREP